MKIALTTGIDASIPEQARDGAYAWMIEHGFGDLVRAEVKLAFGATDIERANQVYDELLAQELQPEIKMAVPPPTLKAWAKERLMAGEELPPALFNVRAYDMARLTNRKR